MEGQACSSCPLRKEETFPSAASTPCQHQKRKQQGSKAMAKEQPPAAALSGDRGWLNATFQVGRRTMQGPPLSPARWVLASSWERVGVQKPGRAWRLNPQNKHKGPGERHMTVRGVSTPNKREGGPVASEICKPDHLGRAKGQWRLDFGGSKCHNPRRDNARRYGQAPERELSSGCAECIRGVLNGKGADPIARPASLRALRAW